MKLLLRWHLSVPIGKFPYSASLEDIPKKAGIYVFLRVHGKSAEALYVGKATNLRTRIKQQFNNLKLMTGLQEASTGQRRLVYAELVKGAGKQASGALLVSELAFIRLYLSLGHDLLNVQGTKLKYQEVHSERNDLKQFLPQSTKMLVK